MLRIIQVGTVTKIACPECGCPMVARKGSQEGAKKFLGCSCFPKCRSALSFYITKVSGPNTSARPLSDAMANIWYVGKVASNVIHDIKTEGLGYDFFDDENPCYGETPSEIHHADNM